MKISSIGLTLVTIFVPVFLMLPDSIEGRGLGIQLFGICLDINKLLLEIPATLFPDLFGPEKPADASQIKFYLWSRRGKDYVRYEVKYGDKDKVKEIFSYYTSDGYSYYDDLYVDVYFHDVASNGNASWILDSRDIFFEKEKSPDNYLGYVIMSVDYADFSKTRDSTILALDLIGNKTSEFLIWMKNVIVPQDVIFDFIGHGIGAIVAAGTAQKTKGSILPEIFVALDPEIITTSNLQNCPNPSQKVVQIPQISRELGDRVVVLHVQTCSISPTIEPCKNSSAVYWGHNDYFPNGGADQPGCNNDETCNRKKATEYFNEANYKNFKNYLMTVILVERCDNYQQFLDRKCNDYYHSTLDFLASRFNYFSFVGRFYLPTKSVPEYFYLQTFY